MIESLNGIFETINCKKSTTLKLYDNDQYEDYPLHWHTVIEIIMPVQNIYTLNFSNQKVVLRENDIMLICPGCVHAIEAPPTGRRIIFQPNTANLSFIKDVEVLLSVMSPYTVITPEDFPQIHETLKKLLLEIKEDYFSNKPFLETEIYSKTLQMFSLIGRHYLNSVGQKNVQLPNQEEYAYKFMDICNYINEHCAEDLKLDDIAELSGFSKYYFERLFKQFTGTSFYKYVNQKRILKAQELLISPQNSVTFIAMNCGFSSISAFIRMFKQIKGCTPTEFKNMYWNKELVKDDSLEKSQHFLP